MKTRLAVVAALALVASPARGVETFSRDTLVPLLNDVNALMQNHYFIQSMLAFDSTPLTFGFSNQQSRANFLRIDGTTYEGALSRTGMLLSLGYGRPATGFAIYGVGNINGIHVGEYPFVPFKGGDDSRISAGSFGAVGAIGLAYKGLVGQFSLYHRNQSIDADQSGRFAECEEHGAYTECPAVPGDPNNARASREEITSTNKMLTLEHASGYYVSAVLAEFSEVSASGTRSTKTKLAALRAIAQPYDLTPRSLALFGAGVATYAADLDYYGDHLEEARRAAERGEPAPRRDEDLVEIPLLADGIADTGAMARLVLQALPSPNFRMLEAGYVYEGPESSSFQPQAGARARLFRRGDELATSADVFLGFFWVFSQSNRLHEGRGVSVYATYSYNSPDSSSFVPIADAHVVGLQLVFGNPGALPPPVNIIRYPATARRSSSVDLSDDEKERRRALDELDLGG